MQTRLLNLWEVIQTSFWFIPGLMIVSAIALSQLMIDIDRVVDVNEYQSYLPLYSGGADGARSVLSTVAGSMITVAGVAFSITIVALTLASSQFGPRLLRNFMRDTGNQIVLGVFLSTFIYCLLILQSVNSLAGHIFVARFSVTVAIGLALISVSFLIYFIHSISTSIHADRVIASVYADISEHIQQLYPLKMGAKIEAETGDSQLSSAADKYPQVCDILATRSGYVQAIDHDKLVNTANENDCLIQLKIRAGDFIVENGLLAQLNYSKKIDQGLAGQIVKSVIIGPQRTPEQDTEFTINQLVEVALRALSPGINDPFTAITCIDHLGAALCCLTDKQFPLHYRYDDAGMLRIMTRPLTFAGVTNTAFDQIRQASQNCVAVTVRLLETFTSVARHTRNSQQITCVLRQADMVVHMSQQSISEEKDKEDIQKCYQDLLRVIEQKERLNHAPALSR